MKFLKDVSSTLLGQMTGLFVVLGINIVVARVWGPEGKGAYSLLLNTASIVMLLSNLGLSQAAIYFLGKNEYELREVTENLFTAGLFLSPLAMLALWMIFPFLSRHFFQGLPVLFPALVIIIVPSMIFRLYLSHLFVAKGAFVWYAGINTLDSVIQLFLLIGIARLDLPLVWALAVCAIVTILVTLLGWGYFVIKYLDSSLKLQLVRPMLLRFIRYGLRSYSVSILTRLNLRLDQFLIVFFLNISTVGVYSVAVALAELTSRIGSAITMALFKRAASQDEAMSIVITNQSLRISTSISIITAIGLLAIGSWLIQTLFGHQFSGGAQALMFLLPGTIMMNAERVLQGFFYGRGKPEYNLYSSATAIAFMLTGNLILTPRFGINGAAISSTVAYVASSSLLLFLYQQTSPAPIWRLFWFNRQDYDAVGLVMRQLLMRGRHRYSTGL